MSTEFVCVVWLLLVGVTALVLIRLLEGSMVVACLPLLADKALVVNRLLEETRTQTSN